MGASMKDIKNRIKSVESTMQITKAMELVSSSKLRRAKERAEKARPFFNILYETISDLTDETGGFDCVYTKKRPNLPTLYVVVAGDRGLAGGYNSNIFKLVDRSITDPNARIVAIGRKSVEHYERKSWKLLARYPGIAENLDNAVVKEISDQIVKLYCEGKIGAVHLAFTQFVTPLTQTPTLMQVLPLTIEASKTKKTGHQQEMIYEPSPVAVFQSIIPQYVSGMIYGGVVESFASEQGARRTAMESASSNAEEMIDNLSLSYNRARQAAITQELTEIVSGANAAM